MLPTTSESVLSRVSATAALKMALRLEERWGLSAGREMQYHTVPYTPSNGDFSRREQTHFSNQPIPLLGYMNTITEEEPFHSFSVASEFLDIFRFRTPGSAALHST